MCRLVETLHTNRTISMLRVVDVTIGSFKFGHQVAVLELVAHLVIRCHHLNLTTRWRHLNYMQI